MASQEKREADGGRRRTVRYDSADAIVADAERLAASQATTTGNWSLGEIIDHLATGVDLMIDGFNYRAPWYVRFAGWAFFKRRVLLRGMPPRLPFPARGNVQPFIASVSCEDALAHLCAATERLRSTETFALHPVFGKLTRDEVYRLHLRHAELHLSFAREP